MRQYLGWIAIAVIGLAIGGAISVLSIQNNRGFGSFKVGQWTAWPLAGSRDSDPYTKAKVASEGAVPLGAAEGIAFHGRADSDGNPLNRNCHYRLSGQTPVARFWTLSAHLDDGSAVGNANNVPAATHSRAILRNPDGSFVIDIGPQLRPGNWVETAGEGPFEIVIRLYDSQISGTAELVDPVMPSIVLMGCPT